MRVGSLSAAVVLAFVPVAMGQGLPELGDISADLLSPQLERKIGEEAYREIRGRDPRYLDAPALSQYVSDLGQRLVAASGLSGQRFEFFLISDKTINAFAMPGGYVGVHTGLLLAAQSESEVASVLAHEVSHVTQHHIARMVTKEKQMSVAGIAAMLVALLTVRSNSNIASAVVAGASAGAIQAQLNYSREFEREADRIGFQLLQDAGFDVNGMPSFFARLQKAGSLTESGAPAYLRTHPLTTERMADLQNRVQGAPYRQVPDSLDFHLVKAELRSMEGAPREAVALAENQLRDRRYASEAGARYALVAALARAGSYERAEKELTVLQAQKIVHPMINLLAAKIQNGRGNPVRARDILREESARQPGYRPLTYALVESYQSLGQHQEALAELSQAIGYFPRDPKLFDLRALSFAATGRRLLQHQALAERYYLMGSIPAAVEQLQFAQTSGDGDFYQLSVIEARLREFRSEMREAAREAK